MSTAKQYKKQFDDAHATFKATETEAQRLQARVNEIGAKHLQATLDRAAIDSEATSYAVGDGPIDDSLAKISSEARNLSVRRVEIDGMLEFLDRALDSAQHALTACKARLLASEQACLAAQQQFYSATLDDLMRDFWSANRSALQRLTHYAHVDGKLSQAPQTDEVNARMFTINHVSQLFQSVLPETIERELQNDASFHEGVGQVVRGDPPVWMPQSAVITSGERGHIRTAVGRGQTDTASIVEALVSAAAEAHAAANPPPPSPEEVGRIRTMRSDALHVLTEQKSRLQGLEEDVRRNPASASRWQPEIEQLRKSVALNAARVEGFTEKLQASRAA